MNIPVLIRQGEKEYRAQAQEGQSILSLLVSVGLRVEAPCGGHGKCGKCLCTALGGVSREGRVHACETRITGPCEIVLPEAEGILSETAQEGAFPADRKCPAGALGFAVDIGTTTLAVSLYDMGTGQRLGSAGGENPQRIRGGDVMTRIEACMKDENALSVMRDGVRRGISALCGELLSESGRDGGAVTRIAVCGNTVMLHLFAGLSPISMGVAPYKPQTLFDTEAPASALGLPFEATVHILPCIGSFIGADCAAGMLAENFDEGSSPLLLADVGTNGELMLRTDEGILCTSAAAGPAFEGAGISCGMCALPGAVSEVTLRDGQVCISTLDRVSPKGICGSGLLSLLSELLRQGITDGSGRLLPPKEAPKQYSRYLSTEEDGVRFTLAPGVYLTEGDVRSIQLAKAAVCAAARVLIKEAGLTPEKVEGLRLAGGFGTRMDGASAGNIGLFPKELLRECRSVGNAAARGCARVLLSTACEKRLRALCKKAEEKSLADRKEFADEFIENIYFERN